MYHQKLPAKYTVFKKKINARDINQKAAAMGRSEVSIFLFVSFSIHALWEAFISLSEKAQIELLGSLASVGRNNGGESDDFDVGNETDDVHMGDETEFKPPPKGYNGNHSSAAACNRGKRGRSKHANHRKAAVNLLYAGDDLVETSTEAFG